MRAGLVLIGTSLGGLRALDSLLSELPAKFPLPIVIIQHRDKTGRGLLAELLQRRTALVVKEAADKEPLLAGIALVAPPDYHLLIEDSHCALSLDAPVNFARPSIDVTFETAALSFGESCIAIILTGNNSDGARGAALIKKMGGTVLVQDPREAESPSMPKAAIEMVDPDHVLSIKSIASYLLTATSMGGPASGRN